MSDWISIDSKTLLNIASGSVIGLTGDKQIFHQPPNGILFKFPFPTVDAMHAKFQKIASDLGVLPVVGLTDFNGGAPIASAGGDTIIVTGVNFDPSATIYIAGANLNLNSVSLSKELSCKACDTTWISDTSLSIVTLDTSGVPNTGDYANVRDASGDDYFDVYYLDGSGVLAVLANAAQWAS